MRRLPQELIRAKRDGEPLDPEAIADFVAGLTDGSVGEGQAAAFAMAVCCRGMTRPECVALTEAMTRSGTRLSWDLPGPTLDKHSTGGIGDAVSLVLAPAVAACGGFVPMISGRGLGHTGGTLDKLDAIPGYRSQPDLGAFRRVVREAGCAIIGQTADLAPADRRLYAIRDVTATVESPDLITASILSKKLAAGLDGLVMDVKVGSGAFLPDERAARDLAGRIVSVARGAGLPTVALLTDMDAPLASAAGNAVEVAYALDYLTGRCREPRFHAVVVALGAEMLRLGGLTADDAEARDRVEAAIGSGEAAERFGRMVAGLGGPPDLLEAPEHHLARAAVVRAVYPVSASEAKQPRTSARAPLGCFVADAPRHDEAAGFVQSVATRALGLAVIGLGGGRRATSDHVDPAVGLTDLAMPGEAVGPDRPLAVVHARSEAEAEAAIVAVRAAYRVGPEPPTARPLVVDRIEIA